MSENQATQTKWRAGRAGSGNGYLGEPQNKLRDRPKRKSGRRFVGSTWFAKARVAEADG